MGRKAAGSQGVFGDLGIVLGVWRGVTTASALSFGGPRAKAMGWKYTDSDVVRVEWSGHLTKDLLGHILQIYQ